MTADTTESNRNRQNFHGRDSVWMFGYGSLLYKVGFDYLERRAAHIRDWQRRFWQGSHDHRGTPAAPGRVLTLVPVPGAVCAGMAYRIAPAVLQHLDVREKNGYLRFETDLQFKGDDHAQGLVYIAEPDNDAWLGPASATAIAGQIANSTGPSGPNRDYLIHLADTLRAMGEQDAHVFAIEKALRELDQA